MDGWMLMLMLMLGDLSSYVRKSQSSREIGCCYACNAHNALHAAVCLVADSKPGRLPESSSAGIDQPFCVQGPRGGLGGV